MSLPVDSGDNSLLGFGLLGDSSWNPNLPDSSGMVENLKKQAIEKVRSRADSARGVLAVNPSTSPLAGAMRAGGGAMSFPSSQVSPAVGLSAFSGGLSEVWSSPLADDFGTDIDTSVFAVRDAVDDIYEKANNAWWGQDDRVPKGSDEGSSKWR
ncbi:hypothetical protein [Actinomyces sp. 565]|uniref:hypothetical protein n=1 Tax=Actinomyces sp. 565 TaxID=2057794 RepID=UPI0013A6B5F6|nr:hypothetical protein [Actinomyces sp. 565]NDR54620.1 hypothetical protein [Actinomyces sp. 565]